MEKVVEKFTLNEKWKRRYIKISQEHLKIFKSELETQPKQIISIIGSRAKKLKHTQYNKENVFKIEVGQNKYVFAAKSEEDRKEIIHFIHVKSQRASLIANQVRKSLGSRRDSISLVARADIKPISFHIKKYCKAMDKALNDDTTQEEQLNFAKLCAEFISAVHQHIEYCHDHNEKVDDMKGISIKIVQEEERERIKIQMSSLSYIMKQKIQGIYVPLLSLFDCNGTTYLASTEMKVSTNSVLSESSQTKLHHLSLQIGIHSLEQSGIKCIEDSKGRLWITDASFLILQDEPYFVNKFINDMNSFSLFAFETYTINDELERYLIPQKCLPDIAKQLTNDEMKSAIEIEMISISFASLLRSNLDNSGDIQQQIIDMFNKTLSNDSNYWNTQLAQEMDRLFHYMIPPCILVPKIPLFFALQKHSGVEMIDSQDYNFDKPLTKDQIVHIHILPENYILSLCENVCLTKNILPKENLLPFKLLNDGIVEESISMLNERASLVQTLYGEQNPTIASLMSLLTSCYITNMSHQFAEMCSFTCKNTNREYCAFYALSALINHDFDYCEKIMSFHLGKKNWMNALLLRNKATLSFQNGDFTQCSIETSRALSYVSEGNSFTDSILYLKCKALFSLNKRDEIQEFISKISDKNRKDLLLSIFSYYFKNDYEKALEYGLQSYEFYSSYPQETITYDNIQVIANICDVLCDYKNAYSFYDALFTRICLGSSSFKEDSARSIIQNIIRLYFKEKAYKDASFVTSIKEKAKSIKDDSKIKMFNDILSAGPIEYINSLSETDYPILYSCIL